MGLGLQCVLSAAPLPAHPSWEKLCLGIGLEGERTVLQRSFLLFPIKILAQKTCLPFLSPVSAADSHAELSAIVPSNFSFSSSSLLLGALIAPGGEWAVGSTAVWKYSAEAIQTREKVGSLSGDKCGDEAFPFCDIEESPRLPYLRLNWFHIPLLCLYGELFYSL